MTNCVCGKPAVIGLSGCVDYILKTGAHRALNEKPKSEKAIGQALPSKIIPSVGPMDYMVFRNSQTGLVSPVISALGGSNITLHATAKAECRWCHGTGFYTGLFTIEKCRECQSA